jgi:hypothetical protein
MKGSSVSSKIVIGVVTPGQGYVGDAFAQSLAWNCANMGQRVMAVLFTGSSQQLASRNHTIDTFLAMEEKPEWLLWWDTDMSVPAVALRILVNTAEERGAKIATVFGVMQRYGHREGQPWTPVPNAYYLGPEKDGTAQYYVSDMLEDHEEPFWCDATGLGFTLVHRDVFEEMDTTVEPWHHQPLEGGWGHDIYFCHRSGEPVLYLPQVRSEHWKPVPLDWGLYLRANGATE